MLVVQGHGVLGRRAEVPGRVAVVVVAERGQGLLQLGHVRPALAGRQVPPGGHRAGQHEQRLAVDLGELLAVGDRSAGGDLQLRDVHGPREAPVAGWPAADRTRRAESDDGALGYTSYWVAGYTTPRIWTDEVRTWETTFAVVTVGGGAAVSAASCCGDFTNDAPISPPTASRAAAMPTPSSTRRRRVSRVPRTACRPRRRGPLAVAGEPSCVTRSSHASRTAGPEMKLEDPRVPAPVTPSRAGVRPVRELCVSLMSKPSHGSTPGRPASGHLAGWHLWYRAAPHRPPPPSRPWRPTRSGQAGRPHQAPAGSPRGERNQLLFWASQRGRTAGSRSHHPARIPAAGAMYQPPDHPGSRWLAPGAPLNPGGQANGPGAEASRSRYGPRGAARRRWGYPSEPHPDDGPYGGASSHHGGTVIFASGRPVADQHPAPAGSDVRTPPPARARQRPPSLSARPEMWAGKGRPTAGRLAAACGSLPKASGRRGAGGLRPC